MNPSTRRAGAVVVIMACFIGSAMTLAFADDGVQSRPAARRRPLATVNAKANNPLAGFNPLQHEAEADRLIARLPEGRKAILTLNPELQTHVQRLLTKYEVPYAGVVAMDPRSGKVLAYVSHSSADPKAGDMVLDASAPAASVFKVITGAALLDAGVGPGTRVCYHGGLGGLAAEHLTDDARRDTACATFQDALGKSTNAIFAKLAVRHLDVATLERYADAFGFGHALPYDVPTRVSRRDVPKAPLEFARTAAGFWHSQMSPLHGALIAATIAADGTMPRASMVEQVTDAQGKVVHAHRSAAFRSVIPRTTASVLNQMMQRTVSHGTARSAFFDAEGNAFLPGVRVAGKTGSLSSESPYRGYSWWVGFAPADAPEIALAVLIVNSPRWRIKASYAARETLRHYLVHARR